MSARPSVSVDFALSAKGTSVGVQVLAIRLYNNVKQSVSKYANIAPNHIPGGMCGLVDDDMHITYQGLMNPTTCYTYTFPDFISIPPLIGR